MQQGMLFHSVAAPESGVYLVHLGYVLKGSLDVSAFAQAWKHVFERHPILRTSFHFEGLDKPVQVVHRDVELPLVQHDWRALAEDEQEAQLASWLEGERRRGIPLDLAPLSRFSLLRTGQQSYRFFWSFHHILMEGWSASLVLSDVFAAYRALLAGGQPQLEPRRPYRDYLLWVQGSDPGRAEAYWRKRLAGFVAPTPFAVDRPRVPDTQAAAASTERRRMQLSVETDAALRSLARQHRLTPNTVLQGVWALLLSRYSGERDVVFGSVVSGREGDLEGIDTMVGLLVNTLPARVRVDPETSVLAWLKALQAELVEMREHEHVSLISIQGWSEVPRGQALFESIFAFENWVGDVSGQHPEGDLETTLVSYAEGSTSYPLVVIAGPGPPLSVKLLFDPRRFEASVIERMLGHLEILLEAAVSRPQARLSSLPLLTGAEADRRREWNATEREYPRDSGLAELFEQQVLRTPEAEALVFGGKGLTYRELDLRSNRLAWHLRALGVGTETRVGICVERSAEMVVGLLGILKAGGAYVPLDPSYPKERLALMLADSGLGVLLTQESLRGAFPEHEAKVLCLDGDGASWLAESGESLGRQAGGANLAYVIYTSGSTGLPKGVAVTQRAVSRLVLSTDYVQTVPGDRVAQASNASFDAATFEIWGALLNGACLVGISREETLSPRDLGMALRRERVTTLFLTTALFDAVAREEPTALAGLTHLLFGGEAVDPGSVRKVLALGRPKRLLHVYGPTETTTYATWQLVEQVEEEAKTIPIGGPIANTTLHVLGVDLERVPVGVPGELFLGETDWLVAIWATLP